MRLIITLLVNGGVKLTVAVVLYLYQDAILAFKQTAITALIRIRQITQKRTSILSASRVTISGIDVTIRSMVKRRNLKVSRITNRVGQLRKKPHF